MFTLGIWQSPSGEESHQLQHMSKQIKSWGNSTTSNKITWGHARIAVQATIGRTLAYPLAATAFNPKQCRQLQTCFLRETLGKAGIVRTFSAIMATAPSSLGGLGFMSFEVEQLIQHINILMQYGPDHQSTIGQLLRSTIEYHALEVGMSGDPLSIPVVTYATKNTWISNTIDSLRLFNITLSSDIAGLHSWSDDDTFIMEHLHSKSPLLL